MGEFKDIVMTKELYIAYDILAKAKYDRDHSGSTELDQNEDTLYTAVSNAINILDKVLFE